MADKKPPQSQSNPAEASASAAGDGKTKPARVKKKMTVSLAMRRLELMLDELTPDQHQRLLRFMQEAVSERLPPPLAANPQQ